MEIVWKKEYEVGDKIVDRQHKAFTEKLAELNAAMKAGQGREMLPGMIEFMKDYISRHFIYEERFLAQKNKEYSQEHRQSHEDFKNTFADYMERIDKDFSDGVIIEIYGFLSQWWRKHICRMSDKCDPSEQG